MSAKKKGFKRKKVEALTLGERLRKLRKERHVSMAEFSKATRIQVKYLRALESGAFDQLPSPVYIKGFLRAYEHFFGIEDGALDKIFEREYHIYHNIHPDALQQKDFMKRRRGLSQIIITPKIIFTVLATILLVGIGVYLSLGVRQFTAAPWIDITEPTADNLRIHQQDITIRGTTHPDAQLRIGDRDVFVNSDGSFSENVGLQPGENTFLLQSTNASGKTTERTITLYTDYTPAIREPVVEENDGVDVEITIGDEETWVTIIADDLEIFRATLPPHSTHTFHAEKEIRITAGKGNDVSVIVNGEDHGLLATEPIVVEDASFRASSTQTQNDDVDTAQDTAVERHEAL